MYATEAEDQEALDIAIAMSLSQQEQSGKGGPPTALPILQGMQGTPVDVEMAGVSPHSSPGTGTGGQYLLPVTTAVPSDGYGYRNHNPPPPPREEESSWISSFVPMRVCL